MKRVAILSSCLTEDLARLPGVATLDWADRAARVLAKMQSRASASVLVGSLDARGFLIQHEITGAASFHGTWEGEMHPSLVESGYIAEDQQVMQDDMGPIRRGYALNEWIGWSLGPITPKTLATTTAGMAGLMRSDSPVWRRWSAIPEIGEVVAGVVAVPSVAGQPRVALVELGLPAVDDPETAAQDAARASAVLEAVLPLLAGKVASALVTADRTQWLTSREEEVLWHLLSGASVPDIALKLGRSVFTVHDHVKSLHRKLGATNRGQLVSRALGHIGPPRVEPSRGGHDSPPPSRTAGNVGKSRQ